MARFEWIRIVDVPVKRLTSGEETVIVRSKTEGKKICIVRHRGKLYGLDAKCPHAGGPLDGGFVNEKDQIVCPWHRFAFELETGQSESGGYFVNTWEIKHENHGLWVKIPKKKFWFW